MELITSHTSADFDAIASMLAAKKIYPGASLAFSGALDNVVASSFNKLGFPYKVESARNIDLDKISRIILVDIRHRGRLGRFSQTVDRKGIEVHIYDHHPPVKGDIKGDLDINEPLGSTTTILALIIKERRISLTPKEATILMLGIYEDTGSLLYPSTTVKDYEAASFLLDSGADLNLVSSLLKRGLKPQEISILSNLVEAATVYTIAGVDILISETTLDKYNGELAIFAHKLMEIEDIDTIFILVGVENRVHLIARNRSREIDAGKIMNMMGGGGHPTAASATMKSVTPIQARERLVSVLMHELPTIFRAGNIMSIPPIRVSSNATISATLDILVRYNINALPVVESGSGSCVGIITRQTIEKAIYHGLGNMPVEDYMSADFDSIGPEAPLSQVKDKLIRFGQRILPVIKGGELTGVITRTDLLRIFYDESVKSSSAQQGYIEEHPRRGRNMSRLMKDRLPSRVLDILDNAGRVAEQGGFRVYVVGGFVRDLLLKRDNLDIDMVVEGDGIVFARQLAGSMRCRIRTYSRFGTAIIIFPDGFKIDVATARLEYYEKPGVLPTVELSSLKLDLYRRDFTINTLALSLNRESFGELIDFFGGQSDIKEKRIRVLHNLSFIEDPTRVFRAVRFSERYRFTIGEHTSRLIKNAVKVEVFENIGGERILNELKYILCEENITGAIEKLKGFGLLRFIHPAITFDRQEHRLIEQTKEVISWYKLMFKGGNINEGTIVLLSLIDPLRKEEREEFSDRFSITGDLRKTILSAKFEAVRIENCLKRDKLVPNSVVYHLMKGMSIETQLYAMARSRHTHIKKTISFYFSNLSDVKTILDGNDLSKLGVPESPLCGKILETLLDKRLDNEIKTAEDEKDLVLACLHRGIKGNESM